MNALDAYRRRKKRAQQVEVAGQLLAVELRGAGRPGVAVVTANGRRIEIARGFDAETLSRLVRVLERG